MIVKNYNIPNKLLFKIIFKTLVYVLNMKESNLKIIPYTATSISAIYIIRNKTINYRNENQILPQQILSN